MRPPMRLALAVAVFVLAVLGAPAPGHAQPVAVPETWGGDLWSRPRLTGSWGGVRDELARRAWCSTSTSS